MTDEPLYIRVSRAPEKFDMSVSTVYRKAKDGEIRIYKRGGGSWLKVAEMVAYIEGQDQEEAA